MLKRSSSFIFLHLLLSVMQASAQKKPTIAKDQDVTSKMQTLYKGLADIITQYHYAPPKFDDKFSETIFKNYIVKLDPNRNIFLKKDIAQLDAFRFKIDDELRGETPPLQFYFNAQQIYLKRLKELMQMPLLTNGQWQPGFEGTIIPSNESLGWCEDTRIRKERWDKQLSYEFFSKEADLQKGYRNKTELIQRVKKSIRNKYDHWFKNRLKPADQYGNFSEYINVIGFILDPHSEYQPPISKSKYDQQMSNMFYGVGITLGTTDQGDIKVFNVMNGMPASKSKKINPGDLILSLSDGANGIWEDVAGIEIPELIEKIRGKAGSVIKLKVKDGKTSVINDVSLVREKVDVQESGARSGILLTGDRKKVGVLYLPEFYNDYAHFDGAKSANDVARELKFLQNEKIDALIFDLRYNGGGSLDDVVKICGYFINYGPVVQVKNQKGEVNILADEDGTMLYSGPLAVLVNGYSASASEIFTAAMQDYKRALIIGTDTYGKGTVQHQLPLGKLDQQGEPEYGAFKLTMEKFYRVNGSTTQRLGIHPDLYLPDLSTYIHVREKDNFSALTADSVDALRYKNYSASENTRGKLPALSTPFLNKFSQMDSLSRLLNSKEPMKIGLAQAQKNNKVRQEAMHKYLELETSDSPEIKTQSVGLHTTTEWYQKWLKTTVSNIWIQRAVLEILYR